MAVNVYASNVPSAPEPAAFGLIAIAVSALNFTSPEPPERLGNIQPPLLFCTLTHAPYIMSIFALTSPTLIRHATRIYI
jgi:hypothetical protein